jgi:hypothetical protein
MGMKFGLWFASLLFWLGVVAPSPVCATIPEAFGRLRHHLRWSPNISTQQQRTLLSLLALGLQGPASAASRDVEFVFPSNLELRRFHARWQRWKRVHQFELVEYLLGRITRLVRQDEGTEAHHWSMSRFGLLQNLTHMNTETPESSLNTGVIRISDQLLSELDLLHCDEERADEENPLFQTGFVVSCDSPLRRLAGIRWLSLLAHEARHSDCESISRRICGFRHQVELSSGVQTWTQTRDPQRYGPHFIELGVTLDLLSQHASALSEMDLRFAFIYSLDLLNRTNQ